MPLDEKHETGMVMLSQLTANTVQNLPSNNFSSGVTLLASAAFLKLYMPPWWC